MLGAVFAFALGQPSNPDFDVRRPTFPKAEVRLADGFPDFSAKSNFVEQVNVDRYVASEMSVAPGLEGTFPVGTRCTVSSRSSFLEEPEVPAEAEALFLYVKRPTTRYTYGEKAVFVPNNVTLIGGQSFLLYRKSQTTTLWESRLFRGKEYRRTLTSQAHSYEWTIRDDSGKVIQSSSL